MKIKFEDEEEKKRFKQSIVIGLIIAVLFIGIGFGAFYLFSKKNTSTDGEEKDTVYTSNKIQLESENKSFKIGENTYKIKYVEEEDNGALYLNNEKIATIPRDEIFEASFVDNYLFIEWTGAQGGPAAWGYFDTNGKYYDLSENDPIINKVSYEDGVIYCYIDDNEVEEGLYQQKKVQLTLDGGKVTIIENNSKDKNTNKSLLGEYTTTDKKHVIKIQDVEKISIDGKELINISMDEEKKNDKYLAFRADFNPPSDGITALSFVLNKETKIIEEKPDAATSWKDAGSECGNWYGEYARFYERCQGFNYLNVNNHYFFIISSEETSTIYTIDWKEIGWFWGWGDNLKYDAEGIYLCEDTEVNYEGEGYKCINEAKYDFNGNKIN